MGSTRYIMSQGELTRKDNSLCFRRDGKNVYIPIENTKEIYCLNEVSINTKLLDFLASNHVVIHFFLTIMVDIVVLIIQENSIVVENY